MQQEYFQTVLGTRRGSASNNGLLDGAETKRAQIAAQGIIDLMDKDDFTEVAYLLSNQNAGKSLPLKKVAQAFSRQFTRYVYESKEVQEGIRASMIAACLRDASADHVVRFKGADSGRYHLTDTPPRLRDAIRVTALCGKVSVDSWYVAQRGDWKLITDSEKCPGCAQYEGQYEETQESGEYAVLDERRKHRLLNSAEINLTGLISNSSTIDLENIYLLTTQCLQENLCQIIAEEMYDSGNWPFHDALINSDEYNYLEDQLPQGKLDLGGLITIEEWEEVFRTEIQRDFANTNGKLRAISFLSSRLVEITEIAIERYKQNL